MGNYNLQTCSHSNNALTFEITTKLKYMKIEIQELQCQLLTLKLPGLYFDILQPEIAKVIEDIFFSEHLIYHSNELHMSSWSLKYTRNRISYLHLV